MASREPSLSIAYFYCTISNSDTQSPLNVLGSLVAQLSTKNPSILSEIRALYDNLPKNQSHKPPIDITALEDAIIKQSSEKSRVILLVDAINESADREMIEASLQRISRLSDNVRIIITSTVAFYSHDRTRNLDLTSTMMRRGIEAYIQYRLSHDETLKVLKPELKSSIEKTLIRNADGS